MKVLRSLLVAVVGSLFFFGTSTIVNADDGTENYVDTYPVELNDGSTMHFFSEEDRSLYLKSVPEGSDEEDSVSPQPGIKSRVVETKQTTQYNRYLGPNSRTLEWAHADEYEMNSGDAVSFTAGYTYEGVSANLTISTSYSITRTLPADPTRRNRLAATGDVNLVYNKIEFYYGAGTVVDTVETITTSGVSNVTHYVQYG